MKVFILSFFVLILPTPASGHDHKENCISNFAKLKPDPCWTIERFSGLWYQLRWYLPDKLDVEDEIYDRQVMYGSDSPGTFWGQYYVRRKGMDFCDTDRFIVDILEPGLSIRYVPPEEQIDGRNFYGAHGQTEVRGNTFIKGNISVMVLCYNPRDNDCEELSAQVLSRSVNPAPGDMAKIEKLLRDWCWPDMRKFIDTVHEKDCLPPEHRSKFCDKDDSYPCGCHDNTNTIQDEDTCFYGD